MSGLKRSQQFSLSILRAAHVPTLGRRLPIPESSASTDQLDTGGDVESAPVAAMLEIGDLGDARHRRRETCIRIRTGTRSAVLSWHDRCYSTALSEPVRSESPVWAIVGDYGPAARGGTICVV
jgi:hypothetical protein